MKYKRLGRTGLKVSEICLGTMTFGSQADEAASKAIVKRALDAGVNFVDTADVYNRGVSEAITGRAIKDVRHELVLATKVHGRMGPGPNDQGQSRAHVMDSVEQSLRRLGTDHIDLYQIHRFDPEYPMEETLRALDDLVRSGKVRYIGTSNYAAWQLCTALWISDKRNLARYDCVQPRYNLISRAIEAELLPLCQAQGVGVIIYNPLGGGMLTGKHNRQAPPTAGTRFERNPLYQNRYWQERVFDAVDRFRAIAEGTGHSMAQIALAWSLVHPAVTSAILGASRVEQLDETLPAIDIRLDDDLRGMLDELWEIVGRREF